MKQVTLLKLLEGLFSGSQSKRAATLLTLVIVVGILAVQGELTLPVDGQESSSDTVMTVQRVVDGDTIVLSNGEKVRYIGINTPESVKPKSPVECFGKEASQRNEELVAGRIVRLERDVSETDKYGRLLRYVYLEDGTFVNEVLLREGYAYASAFPPDVAHADEFSQLQAEAREAERGLWADDTCKGKK